MKGFTRTLCGTLLAAALAAPLTSHAQYLTVDDVRKDAQVRDSDFTALRPSAPEVARLKQAAGTGKVRVIVTLAQRMAPEGLLDESAAAVQRASFQRAQSGVIAAIQPRGGEVMRRYDYVPQLALKVDAKTIDLLAAMPGVARIQKDGLSKPLLQDSVPIVGAADVQDRGVNGTGVVVAVLDTGLNLTHPFVRNFVGEACRSDGDCPNGSSSQTGPGAAAMCTYASECDHGTHVAGIAIGAAQSGFTTLNGMAPGASVMPVQIFSRFTGSDCGDGSTSATVCARTRDSDQIAGLEYVFSRRNDFTIASVNMSIGDDSHHTSTCDGNSLKSIIDQLRSAGIATVIAAGNGAASAGAGTFTDGVSSPGCISSAITVGSVDKSDAMATSSQSASFIDLVAPGVGITSSCTGTSFCSKSGTSMATPHVAGAFALLRSNKSFTVSQELDILRDLGERLHDPRAGGRVVKRINVFEAEQLNEPTLANAVVQDFRQPRPIDHRFRVTTAQNGWSAVATRPGPLCDVDTDLRATSGQFSTSVLAQSNVFGTTAIDVLAQDSNTGRRALGSTFPHVHLASGVGRYDIEYNESALSLFSVGTVPFQPTTLVRVFNLPLTAGVTKFVRAVPATGQNIDLLLFTDDAANAATWVRGRPQANMVVSSTVAAAREFTFTPGQSGIGGLVMTQRAGSGTVTVYADSTAPTGSVVIDGGAATATDHDLQLTLSASDPETGVADMRISIDGTFDTEQWVPFSASAHIVAPPGPRTATVSVQFRNQAHQVSSTVQSSIQLLSALSVVGGAHVVEGNDGTRPALFQVVLDAPAPNPVSVQVDTVDGTATAGSDFTGVSQVVTFEPGETVKTLEVAVNGDTDVEAHETFALALSSPSTGAAVTGAPATATILNDDTGGGPATISIGDASVTEGGTVTGPLHVKRFLSFPLTLSAVRDSETTVDYQTRDGTAHGGTDYFIDGGTAAFEADSATTTIRIAVIGDALGEVNETLFVDLANPLGASIADGTGQGTIVNDDGKVVAALAIDDVRVTEGNSGATLASFTVHLQPGSKTAVSVQVASANGTATAGSDYTALRGGRSLDPNEPLVLTFAPGETTKVVPVRVTADTVREADETFFVRLGNPVGAVLEDAEGVATIVNDD